MPRPPDAYVPLMQAHRSKPLLLALAVLMAWGALDAAAAKKKQRTGSSSAESVFWGGLVPVENGVPVIMKGYHPPKNMPEDLERYRRQRADRPVHIPRGSGNYIPPPNPSPSGSNSPPAAALTAPAPAPYRPPPITTFSDRVNNAIHAYPLEKGIGNNPIDQQEFIRQRLNN